jgi:hypothetical protein
MGITSTRRSRCGGWGFHIKIIPIFLPACKNGKHNVI